MPDYRRGIGRMGGGVNRCRCGKEIPHEEGRRKQPRYCAACRSMYGGNKQKGHKIRRQRKNA